MRKSDYIKKIHRLEKRLQYLKDAKCQDCNQSLQKFITNQFQKQSLRESSYRWQCNECFLDDHISIFGGNR